MKRKKFLSSLLVAATSYPLLGSAGTGEPREPSRRITIPRYLQPGDTIGISCPAGSITEEEIQASIRQMQNWGFNIRTGVTVGKKDFTFAGSDEERARDFQQMLDDPSINAIMCARGGYGSIRIIDALDFTIFAKKPKWIIGFSDITVIHSHLHRNYNMATIHSKMCNSFPDDMSNAETSQVDSILSIRQALSGEKIKYPLSPNSNNRTGSAQAALVGGNLKTIESLSGTASDINTAGKILFLEDTGEYLYSIDRMFWNLKRTGKLSGLKGLIIGGFKIKPDDPGEDFGRSIYDIVLEKVKEYDYPVCFDFPVGHQKTNYAIKCGLVHRLLVGPDACSLTETT